MNGYIEIYEMGMQYAASTESMVKSNKFNSNLGMNMIGLSVECLLGSLVEKNDMYVQHVSVGTLGQALSKAGLFPDSLQQPLKLLSLGCSVCSVTGGESAFAPNIDKVMDAFNKIRDWVSSEIHQPVENEQKVV